MHRFFTLVLAASTLAVAFTVTTAPAADACVAELWFVRVDSNVVGAHVSNCLSPSASWGGFARESGVEVRAWHHAFGDLAVLVADPAADEPVHAESVLLP